MCLVDYDFESTLMQVEWAPLWFEARMHWKLFEHALEIV